MKKAGLVLVVLVVFAGYGLSQAGQWCFQVSDFTEYVKLEVNQPDTRYPYWTLDGVWYHSGWHFIAPVSGTMVKSADGTQRLLSISGSFISDTGGLINVYTAQAIIDSLTKNGTLYLYYDMTNSMTPYGFTKVKCKEIPPPYVEP